MLRYTNENTFLSFKCMELPFQENVDYTKLLIGPHILQC